MSGDVWAKIVAALKRHGVELLPETNEHGAGRQYTSANASRSVGESLWPVFQTIPCGPLFS
jgi:hypothetical protein